MSICDNKTEIYKDFHNTHYINDKNAVKIEIDQGVLNKLLMSQTGDTTQNH